MKKILFLTFILFISVEVLADCAPFDRSECPTTVCPSKTFMGDDGKCYGCDISEDVSITCLGETLVAEICPNRIFPHTGCGKVISRLCPKNACPPSTFMGDDGKCYSCDEEREIDINCIGQETANKVCLNRIVMNCYGNFSFQKCKDGYKRGGYDSCCNGKDCWIHMCPLY